QGRTPSLPARTMAMQALATTWAARACHPEVEADLAWWRSRAWSRFRPLPAERDAGALATDTGLAVPATVTAALPEAATARLEAAVARTPGLSLGDAVACALVRAYGRWTG